MTGIYAIHNTVNDKYYIGQAGDIDSRWMQHRSRLKCQNHENKHLQSAYNIYGKDVFEYMVLEECGKENIDEREQYYIQKYNSYDNGYNQDLGGKGCKGYKHTEEEILKTRMIQNPKAVLQLDKELNIINEWVSTSHAGKTLGLSIRGIKACCCRLNHQKTIGGYYWVYKDEYDNGTVDWNYYLNINVALPKRVSQYDLDMNLIKIWDSAYQASKECGYSNGEISNVCHYRQKTYKRFIWRFTDEYTEEQYRKDLETDFSCSTLPRKTAQYDLSENLLNIYDSAGEASRVTGIRRTLISACCTGKQRSSRGYVWKYID